jgi:ElaB/YqjD/DUF883 family membrane-anchored ribosome-binding protein
MTTPIPYSLTEEASLIRTTVEMSRRTRRADRQAEDDRDQVMDRLTEVLEQLAEPRPPPRKDFKAPHYAGTGNVEIFIRQFSDVADANRWNTAATLLHLRESLDDEARDCGSAATVEEIFDALRARYGLTTREARSKLSSLKKEYKTTLQEHASRVEQLVEVAYPELQEEMRREMSLDHFSNSLGNPGLQRHLLAIKPGSLPDAVRAGNEYLQVRSSFGVKQLEEDSSEADKGPEVAPVQAEPLVTLMEAIGKLTQQMGNLQKWAGANRRPRQGKTKVTCWTCGEEGHVQRQCPQKKEGQPQGNESDQQ